MSRGAVSIVAWAPVLFLAGIASGASSEQATLNRYCLGCHNGKVKTGGFSLEGMMAENAARHPDAWEKVVRKLRARYMPPAGLPRPDERAYEALVSSLESSLDNASATSPNPARTDTDTPALCADLPHRCRWRAPAVGHGASGRTAPPASQS